MSSPLFSTTQVAASVPFDNSGAAYRGADVQSALEEARRRIVHDADITATTLNGTKVLTDNSDSLQILTGTAAGYSLTLPTGTAMFQGRKFEIVNSSSQPVTIKDADGVTLFVLGQTSIAFLTLQSNSTTAGVWVTWQTFIGVASGILNYSLTAITPFVTTSTTDVVITAFTITPTAGTYVALYNGGSFLTTTPRNHWWSMYKAGVKVPDSERQQRTSASNQVMVDTLQTIVQVNGSESLDIRVRTENGSLTINSRSLLLVRLGN